MMSKETISRFFDSYYKTFCTFVRLPKEIIFPGLEHHQLQQPSMMSSEEEVAVVEAKDISNENEIFQQKHKPLGQRVPFIEDYKPPYVVRFNKQNSNSFAQ